MAFVQHVTIKAKPGQSDQILDLLRKIKVEVHENEPETKQYHIAKSTKQEDVIYIWEEYTSQDALAFHRQGKAYKEFLAIRESLWESASMEVCDII